MIIFHEHPTTPKIWKVATPQSPRIDAYVQGVYFVVFTEEMANYCMITKFGYVCNFSNPSQAHGCGKRRENDMLHVAYMPIGEAILETVRKGMREDDVEST